MGASHPACRPAPASPSPASLLFTPMSALFLVGALLLTAWRWVDYDLFWHLANGRLILDQHVLPTPDRFSWTMRGRRVVDYSASVDTLFYAVWRVGGVRGLSLFAALLSVLALLPFALLIGRLRLRPLVEAAALLLLVLTTAPYRGVRPHVMAAALWGVTVLLLERPFSYRRGIIVGFVLAVWTNVHGTFPLGFCLIGAAELAWLWARDVRSCLAGLLAVVIGAAGSLLSPYGPGIWLLPLRTVANPYNTTFNAEWRSFHPASLNGAAFGLLILVAICVGILRAPNARVIAALGMVLPAIQYVRLALFEAPLLLAVTAARLAIQAPRVALSIADPLYAAIDTKRVKAAAWAMLLVGLLIAVPFAAPSFTAATGYPLPRGAVTRLLACALPAPVWNDYNWGGYLIWRSDGRFPVVIDGRDETLYALSVFQAYFLVMDGRQGWKTVFLHSPTAYALVSPAIAERMAALPGWQLAYRGAVGAIARRRGSPWTCR